SVAFGPSRSLPAGYASSWWTQKRNGSGVGHGKPRGATARTTSSGEGGTGGSVETARRFVATAARPDHGSFRPVRERVERAPHAEPAALEHVRVDHRRRDGAVAEQLLDRADVVMSLE